MSFSPTQSFDSGNSYTTGSIDASELSADFVLGSEGPPVAPVHRTRLCRYYAKGCRRGAACPFAHGQHEVVERPDLTKTSLCHAWLAGLPCAPSIAGRCLFAHGHWELRVVQSSGASAEDCDASFRGGCRSQRVSARASAPAVDAATAAVEEVWIQRLAARRVPVMDSTTSVQRSNKVLERFEDEHVSLPVLELASKLDAAPQSGGVCGYNATNQFERLPEMLCGHGQVAEMVLANFVDEGAALHSSHDVAGKANTTHSAGMVGMMAVARFSTQVMEQIVTSQQQHALGVLEQLLISAQPDHYDD